MAKIVCFDGSSARGFMGCSLKQSRWGQVWKRHGEVRRWRPRPAWPAGAGTPVGLVSQAPGRKSPGVPGAPFVIRVTSQGASRKFSGEEKHPPRKKLPEPARARLRPSDWVAEGWTPWARAEVLPPLLHQACPCEQPGPRWCSAYLV